MDSSGSTPALEPALEAALTRVAGAGDLLVSSDFDGTLAPLVDDPARARALPSSETALLRLAASPRTTVALVSGRSVASLRAGVGRLADHAILVGGHGIEREDDAPSPEETANLDTLSRRLDDAIEEVPGAWVERKPFSVVLHVRGVEAEERPELLSVAVHMGEDSGLYLLEGHAVMELLVRAPAKGLALERLRDASGADAVVYLGDDVTDEDAFASLGHDDLGISIGPAPTRAPFRISSPRAAADVLTVLANERSRLAARAGRAS
jgi:trehalose 6-phosphate phosphatase